MRAAIYARISDDREGDELGVKRQIKDGVDLVRRRGGTVVMEQVDNDISALRGRHRPGYEALMAAVDDGALTHIVVFHTSRLWRNRRERAEGIERLRHAGVSVVAVRGPDLDMSSAYGRGMAGLIGEFDTMESEVKSERILRKVEELATAGKIANGGPRPFGFNRIYLGEGPRRKILRDEIDEAEARIVRQCARRALAGDSLRSLVVDLNDQGILTSTGRRWSQQALRVMLMSGRIAGLRERKRQVVGPAVWPAIIEREEHEQLRGLLAAKHRPPGSRVRLHYLTGFLFCSGCVEHRIRMRVGTAHGKLVYKCPARNEGGCNGRVIGKDDVEGMIGRYMVGRLSDPQTLRELAAREAASGDRAAELLEQIDADERRLRLLRDSMEDGNEEDLPEVVGTVRAVRRRLVGAREELARLTHLPVVGEDSPPDLAARWPTLSLARRQGLLRLFVDRILIGPAVRGRGRFDPDRVEIVPRR